MFKLDVRKAIEAAALLLRLTAHTQMDRKRLLALLFLADRESLRRTGFPIIGGRISALKHGPIHSEVYDFIKGSHARQAEWSHVFEADGYRVKLREDSDSIVSSLSQFEVDLLNELSETHSGRGTWDLAELTHTEEYKKNYIEGTSTTIPFEDTLSAVNRHNEKTMIAQEAKDKEFFDNLFKSTP